MSIISIAPVGNCVDMVEAEDEYTLTCHAAIATTDHAMP